jgi:hypothetical protein
MMAGVCKSTPVVASAWGVSQGLGCPNEFLQVGGVSPKVVFIASIIDGFQRLVLGNKGAVDHISHGPPAIAILQIPFALAGHPLFDATRSTNAPVNYSP